MQLARVNEASVFNIYSSTSLSFEDLRILTTLSGSYVALNCSGLAFRRVVMAPAEGRWQAAGVDGIFTIATRRPAPGVPSVLIEDALLETVGGDDDIILKTQALKHCSLRREDGFAGCASNSAARPGCKGCAWATTHASSTLDHHRHSTTWARQL